MIRHPFHSLLFQYVSPIEFSLVSVPPEKLSENTSFPYFKCKDVHLPCWPWKWEELSRQKHKYLFSLCRENKKWIVWSPQLCQPWLLQRVEQTSRLFPPALVTHWSVAWIRMDSNWPISTMEQLSLAEEERDLLQPFLVNLEWKI